MNHSEYNIKKLISHISKDIHFFYRKNLKEYDMGWGQFKILLLLFHSEGIKQEKISTLLDIDKTTATRTLNKLEISNLIERKIDPSDKRVHLIYLTQKSKKLQKYLQELKIELDEKLLVNFTINEIDTLHNLLEKLNSNSMALYKGNIHE